MGDLSANFSKREFQCHHCGLLVGPAQQLVAVLQKLRNGRERPLVIVSGFRCALHNRRVGGVSTSHHLGGRAADIPGGYATVDQAAAAGAVGIGARNGWAVHVDVREGGPARWTY